jgi:hypothetical protein
MHVYKKHQRSHLFLVLAPSGTGVTVTIHTTPRLEQTAMHQLSKFVEKPPSQLITCVLYVMMTVATLSSFIMFHQSEDVKCEK